MNAQPQSDYGRYQGNQGQFAGQGYSGQPINQGVGGQQSNNPYFGQQRAPGYDQPPANQGNLGLPTQQGAQGYRNPQDKQWQGDSRNPQQQQQYVTEWVQQPAPGSRDQNGVLTNQPQRQGQLVSEPYPQNRGGGPVRSDPANTNFDLRGAAFDPRGNNFDQRGSNFDQRGASPDQRGTNFDPRGNNFDQRSNSSFDPRGMNQDKRGLPSFDQSGTNFDQRPNNFDQRQNNYGQWNNSPAFDRQPQLQTQQPTYFVRNEFFCDKYDLLSQDKLLLKVAGEVHRSRNLLTGKDVCVWLLPVQDIPDNMSAGQNQAVQNHLAFSEGLLSMHESFHDGHKYILVTEPVQQTLRDFVLGRSWITT